MLIMQCPTLSRFTQNSVKNAPNSTFIQKKIEKNSGRSNPPHSDPLSDNRPTTSEFWLRRCSPTTCRIQCILVAEKFILSQISLMIELVGKVS